MHTLKPEVRGELDIRKNFCKTDTETTDKMSITTKFNSSSSLNCLVRP